VLGAPPEHLVKATEGFNLPRVPLEPSLDVVKTLVKGRMPTRDVFFAPFGAQQVFGRGFSKSRMALPQISYELKQ